MTTEDAIWTLQYVNPEDPSFSEAIALAVNALRIQAAPDDNPPLTLEELRGMAGEPVWTMFSGMTDDCGYRVILRIGAFFVEFTDGRHLPVARYGKTWLAYRMKPEEGTT